MQLQLQATAYVLNCSNYASTCMAYITDRHGVNHIMQDYMHVLTSFKRVCTYVYTCTWIYISIYSVHGTPLAATLGEQNLQSTCSNAITTNKLTLSIIIIPSQ